MQTKTALKLGMDSEAVPSDAQAEIYTFPQHADPVARAQTPAKAAHAPGEPADSSSDENADHFITRDGRCFAGTHLIIDVFGGSRLDDIEHIRQMMRDAVEAAGATLIHIHLHHFTPNGGVSGVAVLAESHISIHTWPERDYGALDVFMCGDSDPQQAVGVIQQAFQPRQLAVNEHLRGEMTRAETETAPA